MGVLLETHEGQAHQICSLMQADSCRIMSPSKAHLEMMKGYDWGGGEVGLGAETHKSVLGQA